MLNWKKESNGAGVLLLSGARRVGKSFLCEQFGKNEYKSVIIIDFGNVSNEIKDIFENDGADLNMFSFAGITRIFPRDSTAATQPGATQWNSHEISGLRNL